jgi:adenine-specific DNA-methyltransferase
VFSTTSRAFPKPSTGKIAVMVITHYGHEVLKVYEVRAGGNVFTFFSGWTVN